MQSLASKSPILNMQQQNCMWPKFSWCVWIVGKLAIRRTSIRCYSESEQFRAVRFVWSLRSPKFELFDLRRPKRLIVTSSFGDFWKSKLKWLFIPKSMKLPVDGTTGSSDKTIFQFNLPIICIKLVISFSKIQWKSFAEHAIYYTDVIIPRL